MSDPLDRPGASSLAEPVTQGCTGLIDAIGAGDLDRADLLLATLDAPLSPDHAPAVAELHVQRRRWREAADVLSRLPARDERAELLYRLSNNLAAMRVHRPAIYHTLLTSEMPNRYAIGVTKVGRPTVFHVDSSGTAECLSLTPDPLAATNQIMDRLRAEVAAAQPLAVCGTGDGYLIRALAAARPGLPAGGREQPLFLFEADPEAVMTVLTLHDLAGPTGPIEQRRVQWFVGPRWSSEFEAALGDNPSLPMPDLAVRQGPFGAAIEDAMRVALTGVRIVEEKLGATVDAAYQSVGRDQRAAMFGEVRPRRPRALLLGDRFTPSTSSAVVALEEAFARVGWETRTAVEAEGYLRTGQRALRRAVHEFQPDLVVAVDRLRRDFAGGLFPEALPFASWFRDPPSAVHSADYGDSIGPRDFVLTDAPSSLAHLYRYPASQLLAIGPLPRTPSVPDGRTAETVDLAYVADGTRTISSAVADVRAHAANVPELLPTIEKLCREMVEVYRRGEALPLPCDVRRFVETLLERLDVVIYGEALMTPLVNLLTDRLNNLLYRQQGLRWAAEVARKLRLSLAVHGPGWDRQGEFARFAKDPLADDGAAEAVVRSAKINLHLEPFPALADSGIAQGLLAGGFFLLREHPLQRTSAALLRAVGELVGPYVDSVEEARERVDPSRRAALERLLQSHAYLAGWGDPIAAAADAVRSGMLCDENGVLPRLDDVSFSTPQTLEDRVRHFLARAERRREVVAVQRTDVVRRIDAATSLARVLRTIGGRIAAEPDPVAAPKISAAA